MPVNLVELSSGRGILYSCSGLTTGAELIRANDQLIAAGPALLGKLAFGIVDFTATEQADLTTDHVHIITGQDVRLATMIPAGFAVAVIAPLDFPFGMSRMWRVFAEKTGWNIEVFKDTPSADTWLRETVTDPSIAWPRPA
jgi:hypothetical protein